MSRSMYDITNELDSVREEAYAYAEEHDGEMPDYLVEYLDALEGEREQKAENIACLYKDLNAYVDSIKKEEARLSKLKKQYNNEIDRIKSYLSAFINEGEKIKTPRTTISWRKSTSVVLKEGVKAKSLPEEFQNVKIEPAKTALKKAITNGEDLSKYVSLVTENRIQIK